jgi:hypothetical protein
MGFKDMKDTMNYYRLARKFNEPPIVFMRLEMDLN